MAGEKKAGSRNTPESKDGTQRNGGATPTEANEALNDRFTGEGTEGERGYRGRSAPDTLPGSVPGGSHGGGGGVSEGNLPVDSEEGAQERP